MEKVARSGYSALIKYNLGLMLSKQKDWGALREDWSFVGQKDGELHTCIFHHHHFQFILQLGNRTLRFL